MYLLRLKIFLPRYIQFAVVFQGQVINHRISTCLYEDCRHSLCSDSLKVFEVCCRGFGCMILRGGGPLGALPLPLPRPLPSLGGRLFSRSSCTRGPEVGVVTTVSCRGALKSPRSPRPPRGPLPRPRLSITGLPSPPCNNSQKCFHWCRTIKLLPATIIFLTSSQSCNPKVKEPSFHYDVRSLQQKLWNEFVAWRCTNLPQKQYWLKVMFSRPLSRTHYLLLSSDGTKQLDGVVLTQRIEDQSRHAKPFVTERQTRQDKTRQDKDKTNKTRQDKTRQDKTRQDKTRQDKTRQDKHKLTCPLSEGPLGWKSWGGGTLEYWPLPSYPPQPSALPGPRPRPPRPLRPPRPDSGKPSWGPSLNLPPRCYNQQNNFWGFWYQKGWHNLRGAKIVSIAITLIYDMKQDRLIHEMSKFYVWWWETDVETRKWCSLTRWTFCTRSSTLKRSRQ